MYNVSYQMAIIAKQEAETPPSDHVMLGILNIYHAVIRQDGRDLTTRQLASFLLIYTTKTSHTVNTLAEQMNLPPSAMRCLMDRLSQLGLISCEKDAQDRRRIVAHRTPLGRVFLNKLLSAESRAQKQLDRTA
jgi:DNA-binding MarR family transcriptional regulator